MFDPRWHMPGDKCTIKSSTKSGKRGNLHGDFLLYLQAMAQGPSKLVKSIAFTVVVDEYGEGMKSMYEVLKYVKAGRSLAEGMVPRPCYTKAWVRVTCIPRTSTMSSPNRAVGRFIDAPNASLHRPITAKPFTSA